MIVILVFLLVLVLEDDFPFGVVNRRLEDLVRPLIFSTPTVVLVLILEVVVPDVRVSVRNADIDPSWLQNSRYLSEHLLRILLGIGSALYQTPSTNTESSVPLSITQSND
jgi:hypothetical protein